VPESPRIPKVAVQGLASVRSLSLQIDQYDASVAGLRAERQRLLFHANRAGATYEVIAEETGLRPSTVATEIARYRDDNGLVSLPRGRRRGISPKRKETAAAVA
jgi:hypothetical protein